MGVRKRPGNKATLPSCPTCGAQGRSPRRGWLCPCPRTRGKVRKGVRTRTVRKRHPSRPTPSRVQGPQPPPGIQRESPCFQNVGGWARWDNGARHHEPSPLIPALDYGGQVRKHPNAEVSKRCPLPSPKQGAGGAAPAGGTACPPVSKNVGGWAGGTTAHAKPDPALMEGARQDKTPVPVGGRTPESGASATPPLQNTNGCAIVSP